MLPILLDTEIVSAVVWSPDSQLISVSDDKQFCRWSADGEKLAKFTNLNVYATWISWFPTTNKQVWELNNSVIRKIQPYET